jgi:hypothetical protein
MEEGDLRAIAALVVLAVMFGGIFALLLDALIFGFVIAIGIIVAGLIIENMPKGSGLAY